MKIRFKLFALLSAVVSPWVCLSAAESSRPNILLILCDDLGYADVGFNGSTDIRTPQLDKLAQGGTVFTSAYVAHPFCGPSRMSLVTGRYPHPTGTPYNLPNSGDGIEEYNRMGVPVTEKLISSVMQEAGYYTGAIGKWHMGIDAQFHPNNRGFEEYYGFLGGGHDYFPERFQPAYERQRKLGKFPINEYLLPLERNGIEVAEKEYITDGLSREAVNFVQAAAKKDKPFFLYLAYNAPHSPLQAKDEDLALYPEIKDQKRRTYAAMVQAVDRGVGQITATLMETGEYENTLIVFLSDNGGKLSLGANNGPLRDGKGSAFEGGYRVPMFFHWPEHVPAGNTFAHPVTSLDFYPTFAGLGMATIPAEKALDGKNIWAALVKGDDPRPGEFIYAVRHRDGFSDVGARQGPWKVARVGQSSWKLFNLDEDIGEKTDLSSNQPDRVKAMVANAEEWSRSHTEPRWFNSRKEAVGWKEVGMPRYDELFKVEQ